MRAYVVLDARFADGRKLTCHELSRRFQELVGAVGASKALHIMAQVALTSGLRH